MAAEAGQGLRDVGSRGMVGEDGLSIPVHRADMRPMERIWVPQNHRDHHEAGGRESR
jgi:hypothetical protein